MFNLIRIASFLVLLIFFLLSCDNSSHYTIPSNELNDIKNKISKLEKNDADLHNSIQSLQQSLLDANVEIYRMKINNLSKTMAIFTPQSKEFQSISTNLGILLVSLENIEKYASGYKITLEIGNPNNVTYSNLHVTIKYGHNSKDGTGLDILSSKTYDTTIYQDLLPSYWNTITVVLSPAKEHDMDNMWIFLEPEIVKLHRDKENPPI